MLIYFFVSTFHYSLSSVFIGASDAYQLWTNSKVLNSLSKLVYYRGEG